MQQTPLQGDAQRAHRGLVPSIPARRLPCGRWLTMRAARFTTLLIAGLGIACLAPALARAQAFKVAVIRATFADDASNGRTQIYSIADIQRAAPEIQQYYDELSYGRLSLQVTVADAPDLTSSSTFPDDTSLFQAALDSATRAGYGPAVANVDAVLLLTAGWRGGNCGAYYGQLPLTSRSGGIGDIKLQEDCESRTPIGTEPAPAPVDWGGWAHEIGHALQAANGRAVFHPAGYADGYNLMDSCYPCGAGVFDLTGAPIVGSNLSAFPGWLPSTKVAVLPAAGTSPTTDTRNVAPLGVAPTATRAWQGVKVPLDSVDVPVGGGGTWHSGSYYLVEARARTGADSFGAVGQPRLADEGVEIHRVDEQHDPPVTVIRPCDDQPSGMRCEGDPGAQFDQSYCNAHPAPLAGSCWPFDLWHAGQTLHGLDGVDISVQSRQADGSYPVTVTRGARPRGPDPYIIPWQTPPMNTWETVDLWIDSSCNGYEYPSGPRGPHFPRNLRYGRRSGSTFAAQTVISNGDDPCGDHPNRVYARVHNGGDETAHNVRVHFEVAYHNFVDPANPVLTDLGTSEVRSIRPGSLAETYVTWTPSGDPLNLQQPDWIQATVEPSTTNVSTNTFARENVLHFEARHGLPMQVYPHLPLPVVRPGDPARYFSLEADRVPANAHTSLSAPLSFAIEPGKPQLQLPIDVRVPRKARAGSSFLFDIETREFGTDPVANVGATSPEAAVHYGVDTTGGLALIAQVVKSSKLSVHTAHDGANALSVKGVLHPATRTAITLDYLPEGARAAKRSKLISHLVKTDRKGRFQDRLRRHGAGKYHVRAIWMGTKRYAAVMTGEKQKKLGRFKAPSLPQISPFGPASTPSPQQDDQLSVTCPQGGALGSAYTVTGRLSPNLASRQLALLYSDGTQSVVRVVTTDTGGGFEDSFAPAQTGTWTVSARWPGDLTYHMVSSPACATVVAAQPTSLSLSCPGKANAKGPLAVSGALTPGLADAPLEITYTEPNGTIVDTVTTDADGSYKDSTTAVSSGSWQIRAHYGGDAAHEPADSAVCTTTVS